MVDARRSGDENLDSSVIAENLNLLVNSSYDYQIMDRNKDKETKYLSNEKTHKAIKGNMFKRLNNVSKELCEIYDSKIKD